MDKKEKEKKLKILLPVLIVISIFVWIPNFQDSSGQKKNNAAQGRNEPVMTAAKDILDIIPQSAVNVQRKKSSFREWGRNPFIVEGWRPRAEKAVAREEGDVRLSEEEIVLQGIFYNRRKPSVLISDKVLGVGMKFGRYTIVDISPSRVIINDGSLDITLTMREEHE